MIQAETGPRTFRWRVRVYYEDTDAAGVVFYANYLRFMERARTEWLRALGFEQARLRAEYGILFVARRADLRFLRPARLDDMLLVTATIEGPARAAIDFRQEIQRERNGDVCCRGIVNVACVDAERLRPARIPGALMQEMTHGR